MIGLGLGAAALVFPGYFVRTGFQWVDELELSAREVTQVSRGVSRTLPWTRGEGREAVHPRREQWVLSTLRGQPPMTIRADGVNRERCSGCAS